MFKMKKAFQKVIYSSIVSSLLFLALGIFLMIFPGTANEMTGYILGTLIIISGINAIVKFFLNQSALRFFDFEFAFGILSILAGLLVMFHPLAFTSAITVGLGLWMIVYSTIKMQYAFALRVYHSPSWILTLIIGITTLMLGLLVIFNPFEGQLLLTRVIGIFVSFYAILDIVECLLLKKDAHIFLKKLK